jgi:hypothetical protein
MTTHSEYAWMTDLAARYFANQNRPALRLVTPDFSQDAHDTRTNDMETPRDSIKKELAEILQTPAPGAYRPADVIDHVDLAYTALDAVRCLVIPTGINHGKPPECLDTVTRDGMATLLGLIADRLALAIEADTRRTG